MTENQQADSPDPVALASASPPADRRGGIYLHVTSLPGPYGIGDLGGAAYDFVDWLRAAGLSVWQFLPLGPTGHGNSPYQPLSSFAGNELLIGIDDLVNLRLLDDDEADDLRGFSASRVDYDALAPRKAALLALAADRFTARASPRLKAAFDDFAESFGSTWLDDYALFRVLKPLHGEQSWLAWPDELRRREPAALREASRRYQDRLDRVKVLQFLFDHQWQALRRYANDADVVLFGDLPIYIALDSADAWSNPGLLCLDAEGYPTAVAGVPPDYFSEDGQLWGNPLYDWPRHRADGYRWWIERLRSSLRIADLVRIDHFRAFESYWSVSPHASTAREGRWEPGPRDEIFHAFRAEFGGLPIVAENLGIITDEVEALRYRQRLPGMVVLQFAVSDPGFRLENVGENEICYTGTHDNDTTRGWFHGGGVDTRNAAEVLAAQEAALRVTGGSADSIALDLVEAAFSSKARMAIAPMQDFLQLGSAARMNTPGKAAGNWCWRATAEQFSTELCDNIAGIVARTAREVSNVGRKPG